MGPAIRGLMLGFSLLIAFIILVFVVLVILAIMMAYPALGIVLILLVLGFLALCVRWYNNKMKLTAPVTP
jgi:succinate-acetate transporter protein